MRKILPNNVTIPTGYELVGNIAHFNLRGEQLKYKKIIGKVILAKNKGVRTVVNKSDALSNVYRTPELEILAGE